MTVSAQDHELMAVLNDPEGLDRDKSLAWTQLLERHYCDLCAIASRLLRRVWGEHSTAHAEDVVQETFARLLIRRHHFDPNRPFRPWAFRVVRNVALGMWRREHLRQRRPLAADIAGRERSPLEQLISREMLDILTHDERLLFQEFYLEGRSAREVAGNLGWPTARVYRVLYETRARLRAHCRTPGRERRRSPPQPPPVPT